MDEEKQLTPPQNEDEKKELLEQAKNGSLVRQMTETKGWNEVVQPDLINRKLSLMGSIGQPNDLKEFITLQQAICSIDNLLKYISGYVQLGEIAGKRLKLEYERRSDEDTSEAG